MKVSVFPSHIVNVFMKFENIEIQGGGGSVGNYSDSKDGIMVYREFLEY